MRIGKFFTAEAAHRVPNHKGKCARLHGHSYKIGIHLEGPVKNPGLTDSDAGMVTDFDQISSFWKEYLEPFLDHRNLNDSLRGIETPTAEMIALWIMAKIHCSDGVLFDLIYSVTVEETANTIVTIRFDDPMLKTWGPLLFPGSFRSRNDN